MGKTKLPLPESQIQEVLYELIHRPKIDRRTMMLHANIMNLPTRIFNLRDKGVQIESKEIESTNKYGRSISFVQYRLKNKSDAISTYYQLKENQVGLPKNN